MNYALIFAGGVGSRMNTRAKPKQFLEIHGKPILIYTIEQFEGHPLIDQICVVCLADKVVYVRELLAKYNISKVKWVIPGGASAMESQYNGLMSIQADSAYRPDSTVLIHDGVRPLINDELITSCIECVREHGNAITVAPAIETIIRADDHGEVINTIPRNECLLARAPQCFRIGDIIQAHMSVRSENNFSFIDSCSLMIYCGYKMHTVKGPSENIKVTNPADFYICRALLDAREDSQLYGL